MKASKKNLVAFQEAFTETMKEFVSVTVDYKYAMAKVIESHNFKNQMDAAFFRDLAREAILRKMEGFATGERAVQDVAKFLDGLEDDLEEQCV